MTVATLPTPLKKLHHDFQALTAVQKQTLVQALSDEEREEWLVIFQQKLPVRAEFAIPTDLIIWQAPAAQNLAKNTPDFWPEEETADEFDAFIRELRQSPRILDWEP
jgi:hypothetical protein